MKYILKGGTVNRASFVQQGPEGEQVIPIAWDAGDQEFDRFKSEVNQNIPNLTKEWWDRIEVHLHGGIYQGQVEYGIVDDEEEEEDDDISKIVKFLLSKDAEVFTGQLFIADYGFSIGR